MRSVVTRIAPSGPLHLGRKADVVIKPEALSSNNWTKVSIDTFV
jgi:hypothetical protein